MYIDVSYDGTDTLSEATTRLEHLMRFPSNTGPDSQVNPLDMHLTPEGITVVHKTMMHGPALRNLRRQQLLHRLPHPAQKLLAQDVRNFLI